MLRTKRTGGNLLRSDKYDKLVKQIPFLSALSEVELRRIIIRKRFWKNQIILYEEDTAKFIYFIYTGKVKAVQYSIDGKERILAIHKKGDFFGEMAILDGKSAPATIIAMEDAEIGFISKEDFEWYLMKNEDVVKGIIAMLCERLREAWLMLKVTSFADAEHRIRSVLMHMADQFGIQDSRGTIINIKLTHKDLAHLGSISRETATRFLNSFEKNGEIEILENKAILLKPAFLNKTTAL
jgi:CRP/FNR family cyclic AMP-dependent transcriptional regulator